VWKKRTEGGRGAARQMVREETALREKLDDSFVIRACSACAGDYEDPERTAWTTIETDELERGDLLDSETKEFPVPE
jgi:hypothetical protein